MGLDVTAFRKLRVVENPEEYAEDELWTGGASMEWSEKCFPGRSEGIDINKSYLPTDCVHFAIGTYGFYNEWRNWLNELRTFHFGKFVPKDTFEELINFADNEGVIGPVVSAKLLKDFTIHENEAKAFSKQFKNKEYGELWFKIYKQWQTAFEFAADNGAVDFTLVELKIR